MGTSSYRLETKHAVRCEKCSKLVHHFYRIRIGDYIYNFCSGACAQAAQNNYNDKISKGITPSNLTPLVEEPAEEEGATYAED